MRRGDRADPFDVFIELLTANVNSRRYAGEVTDSENFEGRDVGSGISVIRESTHVVGSGPRLHRHP